MTVLAVLLFAPAWFITSPWGLAVHAGALLVGAGGGLLLARARSRKFEASIRDGWSNWMRFAVACESVADIHRRIGGGGTQNRAALHAIFLTILWSAEVAFLALAFGGESSLLLGSPAIALLGMVTGGMLAAALQYQLWLRGLEQSVGELVDSGELGVWGVL